MILYYPTEDLSKSYDLNYAILGGSDGYTREMFSKLTEAGKKWMGVLSAALAHADHN